MFTITIPSYANMWEVTKVVKNKNVYFSGNYFKNVCIFRKQLEKAYKLCSKCENVVKSSINKQNYKLGIKLTQLGKKGLLLLDLNKSYNGISKEEKLLFLKKLIKIVLIIFVFINLAFIIMQLKMPVLHWTFLPNPLLIKFKDFYTFTLDNIKNMYDSVISSVAFNLCYKIYSNASLAAGNITKTLLNVPIITQICLYMIYTWKAITQPHISVQTNVTLMCFMGTLFQFLILTLSIPIYLNNNALQLLMWVIILSTHWTYSVSYKVYFDVVQIVATTVIIYSLCFYKEPRLKLNKITFKKSKLQTQQNLNEFSDSEEFEGFYKKNTPFDAKSTFSSKESLNQSFISAKNCFSDKATSIMNDSLKYKLNTANFDKDYDIQVNLNKLHLGNYNVNRSPPTNTFYVNHNVDRPKPVISPAKFKNITQNSWVAGGFWRDPSGIILPNSNCFNLSRSSSRTSGFVDESNQFNSSPPSMNNSFTGKQEYNSIYSEPLYSVNGILQENFNPWYARVSYSDMQSGIRSPPLFNQDRLIYITPNYTKPYNIMHEIFMDRNVLSNNFSSNSYVRGRNQHLNKHNF